jgi:hypothetical protein
MLASFIHSLHAELLKTRRSLASWTVVVGAFFTPIIIIIARIVHYKTLTPIYSNALFWEHLWKNSWESMVLFLLPLGLILTISLLTQLEYKNNTWKQLYTLPISLSTIFFSKLIVILLMMVAFFVLFNFGVYLAGVVPYLVVAGVPYPKNPIPYNLFLQQDFFFFVDLLPIVALQYLISLQYKNFLVPVGVGFILWIGAIVGIRWEYGYSLPYIYGMLTYLKTAGVGKAVDPPLNLHVLAFTWFTGIMLISYFLFLFKKEKG